MKRNRDHEADEERGEADADDDHDQQRPDQQRHRIGEECPHAGQGGNDGVGATVEHHRHGHHADREHDAGEERADGEVSQQEIDMLDRHDLRHEALKVGMPLEKNSANVTSDARAQISAMIVSARETG